jgi:hypothetical protein
LLGRDGIESTKDPKKPDPKSGKPDPEKIHNDGIILADATNSNKAVWF